MASPSRIREAVYTSGTTLSTSFTNAATINGTKIRLTSIGLDGLTYASEEDQTLDSQLVSNRENIATHKEGALKIGMYLEGAYSNTDSGQVATLMSYSLGGLEAPGARTDLVETSSTATTINATSHGRKVGTAVMVGSYGDGQGNGEVHRVGAINANDFTLAMALNAAPDNADTMVYSTTVFFYDTTQTYSDWLVMGKSAEDQVQAIGCAGPFTVSGLGPREVPMVEFELMSTDWAEVASANRASLSSTSPSGGQPAINRSIGAVFIGDNGATTRGLYKATSISINPGITFAKIDDPAGPNYNGGWKIIGYKPTFEFELLIEGNSDPLPGFYDDFAAQPMTAKQVLIQFGHTATRTVAFDFPKAYFDTVPIRNSSGELMGVKISGHGNMVLTGTTSDQALSASPMNIHFF